VIAALLSALNSRSVSAVLLAVGVGVAYFPRPRGGSDLEAIEAAALQPSPLCPPATMGFRFPAPDAYPLETMPWIESRADFVAYFTRGEDPELVRLYSEGPEQELIDYLGEVFRRSGHPAARVWPPAGEGDDEVDLARGDVGGEP
jgi:hypothetical protein